MACHMTRGTLTGENQGNRVRLVKTPHTTQRHHEDWANNGAALRQQRVPAPVRRGRLSISSSVKEVESDL